MVIHINDTCVISSLANDFKIVVFPALSNPKRSNRNSLSGLERNFLKIDKSPC